MIKNSYEMEVLVNGKKLPEHFHDYKTYIEGKKDSVFQIRLKNNSSEKVLFVPSVDGLSVMDGKDASFNSTGYIVEAYSSMIVDGWRLSNDEVAEFYFSSADKSYRQRQGKGNNLGSIGLAVFREKQKPIVIKEYVPIWHHIHGCGCYKCYPFYGGAGGGGWSGGGSISHTGGSSMFTLSAGTSGGSSMSAMNCSSSPKGSSMNVPQDIGTGFGDTVKSQVVSATFDREATPTTVMEIFYNTRQALEALGIELDKKVKVISKPNSFPNQPGFCERPEN